MSPVTVWQKVTAGAFILLAVLVWLFLRTSLGGVPDGSQYFTLLDQSVRGLAPSSLVCYNGIPIGQVTKISNDFSVNKVRVDFIINEPKVTIFGDMLVAGVNNTLFSFDIKYRRELGSNQVTPQLQKLFDDKGYPLAENCKIEMVNPESDWLIRENDIPVCAILAREEKLIAYIPEPGTRAEIVTSFVTGLQYIDLKGGRAGYPELKQAFIPAQQGSLAKLQKRFDDIVDRVDDIIEKDLAHVEEILINVKQLTYNANEKIFGDSPQSVMSKIQRILDNAEKTMGEETQQSVQKILSNLERFSNPEEMGITRLIARVENDTRKLLRSANKLTADLNEVVKSKNKRDDLTTLMARVNRLVVENESNIKEITTNLSQLSAISNRELRRFAEESSNALQTLNHFLQKELYQTNMEIKTALKEISAVMRILKAKPNALLWGAGVDNR